MNQDIWNNFPFIMGVPSSQTIKKYTHALTFIFILGYWNGEYVPLCVTYQSSHLSTAVNDVTRYRCLLYGLVLCVSFNDTYHRVKSFFSIQSRTLGLVNWIA